MDDYRRVADIRKGERAFNGTVTGQYVSEIVGFLVERNHLFGSFRIRVGKQRKDENCYGCDFFHITILSGAKITFYMAIFIPLSFVVISNFFEIL